jgi:hypothetical protein
MYAAVAAAGGIPKGAPRRAEKRAKRRTEKEVIAEVRAYVFDVRDRACRCGFCKPQPTDEMNEIVPRSATRGLDPEVRFSRANCLRLSRSCHRDLTEHRKALEALDTSLGAEGDVLVWASYTNDLVPPLHCGECRQSRVQLYTHRSAAQPRCRKCVEVGNEAIVRGGGAQPVDRRQAWGGALGRRNRPAAGRVVRVEPGGVPQEDGMRESVRSAAAAVECAGGEGEGDGRGVLAPDSAVPKDGGAARPKGRGRVRGRVSGPVLVHGAQGGAAGGDAAPERPEPVLERSEERLGGDGPAAGDPGPADAGGAVAPAAVTGAVQKPVTQPKRPAPPRTGSPPVTKGLKAEPKFKSILINSAADRELVLRALRGLNASELSDDETRRRARLTERLENRQ